MVDPFTLGYDEFIFYRAKFIIMTTAFTSFMLWDFIICLPAEIRYIFYPEARTLLKGNAPEKRHVSLPTVLLLVARCLAPIMFALPLTIIIGQPSSCAAVYRTIVVLYSISYAIGSAIFTIRTVAIRNSRWPLKVALWTVWLSQIAVWLYWSFESYITQVARQDQYTLVCQPGGFPDWTWTLYLEAFIFDAIILMLTLQGQLLNVKQTLLPMSTRDTKSTTLRSNVSQIFFQDTLMYFALSTAVTVCVMAWSYTHRHDQITVLIVFPIHLWLNLSISPRVVRSLKLYTAKGNTKGSRVNTLTCSICGAKRLSEGCQSPDQQKQDGLPIDIDEIINISTAAEGTNLDLNRPNKDQKPFQYAVTPVLDQ